jgi:hypothetical protein
VPKTCAANDAPLTEKDVGHWKLLRSFREQLDQVFAKDGVAPGFEGRQLAAADYLSLFLFGLLNPVTQTLRGLSKATLLQRVQQEVCGRVVPRATFSEAQHVLDPALLEKVFNGLSSQIPPVNPDQRLDPWQWLARDGSLFRALPRMAWALYGGGRKGKGSPSRAVRLHLSLHIGEDKPVQACVRPGRDCERAVWKEQLEEGAGYIGDRYFGENYKLFNHLDRKGCAFVLRLMSQAVIHVEEELPLTQADRDANLIRQAWVYLGSVPRNRSMRLRLVWIKGQHQTLILATNLSPQALSAELVGELYRKRWHIELFFRWVKCILKCNHWLAESRQGVTLQIYLALIAALLLQLYTGRRPTKRMMELIHFYLMGWATPQEVQSGLEIYRSELERRKRN